MMNEKQRKERQARYSLYSTDSEDQVASTHRGLDRCAALLKSLLSPEKGLPLKQQLSLVRRRPAPCHATDSCKITKASTAGKTKDPGAPKTPPPRFPGASRHPPPPASSPPEPSTRHPGARTDSKRAGKPLGTVGKSPRGEAPAGSVRRVRVMSQPRVAESVRMKSARRLLVAHRRLRTEPGRRTSEVRSRGEPGRRATDVSAATSRGVRSNQLADKNVHLFASLGNTNGAQTGNVVFSRVNQPADGASSATQGSVPSDPDPPGTTSAPQAPPPSLGYRYPYAVPPLPFPSPYAYYPPFWPYFHPSAPFAPPISSQGLAPSQPLQPGPAHPPSPLRSSSLPHLAQMQAQSHAKPFPGLNSRSNLGRGHKNPDATVTVQSQPRTDHSNKSTPVTTSNAMATVETPTTALTVTSSASASRRGPVAQDCEVLQCVGCPSVLHCRTAGAVRVLAEEMLCSVTDSVVRIRGTAGTANAELLKSLQDLEDTQKSYRERLTALCDQLQGAHGVVGGGIPHSAAGWMDVGSLPSAADWLAQLQQLESEKSHLLERVVQSEMAYSETKGLLDQAEEKAGHLRKELEEKLLSLKSELVMMSEALRTVRGEKTAVEEELELVRTVEVKFTAQAAALERQVSSLEQQLSGSKEALCRCGDQLSAVRCALETGREERQMLQLSLAEKETELVQAQDRLLGLRQCLAYFLSDVVKLDAPLHHSHHQATCTCTGQHSPPLALHYRVPQEAVQRLQSLVNEGNVERFLAAYNSLPLRDSEGSPLASLHDSPTPINTSSPLLSKSTLKSSLQLSPSHSLQLSPTHSLQPGHTHLTTGMTSPVQLCTDGDGSLKCAHTDSDGSTTVAEGHSPENTGKAEAKSGPPENSQLRTAFEVALFQQPGSEVLNEPSHVVHTTAAHNKVSHPHALRNSSPKSPASNRSGSGAASVTATDLHSASVLTTSSEVEFRRDLASLDADIARLQMQFRVAMQRQPRPTHL